MTVLETCDWSAMPFQTAKQSPRWRTLAGATALALVLPLAGFGMANAASTSALGEETLVAANAPLAEATAAVTAAGGQVTETFEVADALVVQMPDGVALPSMVTEVPEVDISFNRKKDQQVSAELGNTFTETIGANDEATGAGVTVAVVDTGVADVPDLPNVEHVNVTDAPTGDGYGHGTFMAGLIAGTGTASGGEHTGVAPDAKILDVQVADADGSTDLRTVLRGLDAVNDRQAVDPSLQVMLLSLSTGSPLPPHIDPLSRALTTLWAQGVTVVVASGNEGKNQISAPATNPLLMVVGSLDENGTTDRTDDSLSDFSAFGKKFGVLRPDLVAPGRSLVATTSPGSIAVVENPQSLVGDGYIKGTGTSMSAAVAAGASAALLSARPGLAPAQVKGAFVATAYEAKDLKRGAAAGGLDLGAALALPDEAFAGFSNTVPAPESAAPGEEDAAAWAEFAAGWEEGDLQRAVNGWINLSPTARKWAADAWAVALLTNSLGLEDAEFEARKWAARKWATENWNARKWAEDDWVARKWAARKWADVDFEARKWAARKWAEEDWLAFAWMARKWASDEWVARKWADSDWEGRKWAGRKWADDSWDARKWAGRKWADSEWVARKWASDAWDARKWADVSWDARKWADMSWEARKWATEDWSARKWAVTAW